MHLNIHELLPCWWGSLCQGEIASSFPTGTHTHTHKGSCWCAEGRLGESVGTHTKNIYTYICLAPPLPPSLAAAIACSSVELDKVDLPLHLFLLFVCTRHIREEPSKKEKLLLLLFPAGKDLERTIKKKKRKETQRFERVQSSMDTPDGRRHPSKKRSAKQDFFFFLSSSSFRCYKLKTIHKAKGDRYHKKIKRYIIHHQRLFALYTSFFFWYVFH